MTRRCYYVAADHRNGPRPATEILYATRVYRSESEAHQAVQRARDEHAGHKFKVESLTDIPEWATEVQTVHGEVLHPCAVPDDTAHVYAMRHRPVTQYGNLPRGAHLIGWTRVPSELAGRFPQHPISKRLFGEFVSSRKLTDRELIDYEIDEVG